MFITDEQPTQRVRIGVSKNQLDFQLIPLDDLILLSQQFRHVPGAVDVSATEPLPLVGRQKRQSVGADLGGVNEDCGLWSAQVRPFMPSSSPAIPSRVIWLMMKT